MNSIKAFRITTIIHGKIKDIIAVYYKDINKVPIFSCNDINSCRMYKLQNNQNIIVIGSNLINKLSEQSLEILAWSLILKTDTGLSKISIDDYNTNYIDRLLASIFGVSAVVNFINQISNIDNLYINQQEYLNMRKQYLEEMIFKNFELRIIDVDSILNRVRLAQILEVD